MKANDEMFVIILTLKTISYFFYLFFNFLFISRILLKLNYIQWSMISVLFYVHTMLHYSFALNYFCEKL